jgi:DNA integrity scanning protein DisA with diadenylate cyclase activity
MIEGAAVVAREAEADAVLLAAALPEERAYLHQLLGSDARVLPPAPGSADHAPAQDIEVLMLPQVRLRRRGRAKIALLEALAAGLLQPGERVVVLSGIAVGDELELDTLAVMDLDDDTQYLEGEGGAPIALLREVADPAVFDALLTLCVEVGHEGKEGKAVGLLATLGDAPRVLERSHPLVLNPFAGHSEAQRSILVPAARRAVREFSGVDGAFVFTDEGIVLAAGRYLQDEAPMTSVPAGLGARHRAAAGITATTRCIAFCVSESSGDTRIFGGGRLLMTIERTD